MSNEVKTVGDGAPGSTDTPPTKSQKIMVDLGEGSSTFAVEHGPTWVQLGILDRHSLDFVTVMTTSRAEVERARDALTAALGAMTGAS
jgi:hypothetical protein